jgi:predicted protein tyrosine phosphatase
VALAADGTRRLRRLIRRMECGGCGADRQHRENLRRKAHAGKITRAMGAPSKDPVRTLFVCQFNRKRSATAERVFAKDPTLDVLSAGTSEDALVRVNERMLDWADIVFVMDGDQRRDLQRMFPEHPAIERLVCLEIEDDYHFLDPQLIALLQERARPHLDRLRGAS